MTKKKKTTIKKNTVKNGKNIISDSKKKKTKKTRDSKKSKKGKKSKKNKNIQQNASLLPEEVLIEKPTMRFTKPINGSELFAGLEVYRTDEENFIPYESPYNQASSTASTETEGEDTESDTETEEDTESESENSNTDETDEEVEKVGFKLHQGEILDTYYYQGLNNIGFETDYAEMTNEGNIVKSSVDLDRFYKGVKLKVLAEWKSPYDTGFSWTNLEEALYGFITEQTFKDNSVEIKVSGHTKLLEKKAKFKFSQLKRSLILQEVILTAGMIPYINVDGLDDDVTDFSNESSGSSGSNQAIGESSGNIAEIAQSVCKGLTDSRAKAQAIHTYIRDHVNYPHPNYYNHRKCPVQVLKSGLSNCCDRARLGHEMANAVGLKNRGVLGPGHVWIQYWIGNKWVNSDPGVSRPRLGGVYNGLHVTRVWSFPSCK